VQVPGEINLVVLHEVVQSVMGGTNSHLHEFEIAGRRFGSPDPDWGDQQLVDEAKGRLFRLVGQGDRCRKAHAQWSEVERPSHGAAARA
jgi:hypothetical protein